MEGEFLKLSKDEESLTGDPGDFGVEAFDPEREDLTVFKGDLGEEAGEEAGEGEGAGEDFEDLRVIENLEGLEGLEEGMFSVESLNFSDSESEESEDSYMILGLGGILEGSADVM